MQLDFNSIAKGYTVDLLAQLVESFGARNYIVDIGGEVRCKGVNRQGDPWRIGIETPFDGNMSNGEYLQRRIGMTEGGLATSGNYRRFYLDAKGNKIAHTIDPARAQRRFAPAVGDGRGSDLRRGRRSGNHVPGDGGRRALAAAKSMPRMKVYFILADGADGYEEYVSPAMKAAIMQ